MFVSLHCLKTGWQIMDLFGVIKQKSRNMNRIILIGNGFDLAHGLKTSYADFIDWYWDKRISDLHSIYSDESIDVLCAMKLLPNTYSQWQSFYWTNQEVLKNKPGKDIIKQMAGDKTHYRISKSTFFSSILHSYQEKGWVDIEKEYFRLLFPSAGEGSLLYMNKPAELNKELEYIRYLLIEYLDAIEKNIIDESIVNQCIKKKMFSPIRIKDISIGSLSSFIDFIDKRFNQDEFAVFWSNLLAEYEVQDNALEQESILYFVNNYSGQVKYMGIESIAYNEFPNSFTLPDRIMLVNFNYTTTADAYLPNSDRFVLNHIHGELNKPGSVIFGYGDEIDERYKIMSEKNDNEYLQNIKSIKYLESPNYRNLLEFMESAPYQVFVIGHSCGNSDRTLLNTLFEHKNCVSIKPFYYIRKDGTDNYMELVQNISRNFTDMKLMRDRVVNKTFCEPYSDARESGSIS